MKGRMRRFVWITALLLTMLLIACGGSGGGTEGNTNAGPGSGGDDGGAQQLVTIKGTVAGTVVVAIDENDEEVDRQTAYRENPADPESPKVFILQVPVGGTYRLFLIENEDEPDQTVFPVYNEAGETGTNVFTFTQETEIQLGLVSTDPVLGIAIPINNPSTAPGVEPKPENTTVPPSLGFAGIYEQLMVQYDWNINDGITLASIDSRELRLTPSRDGNEVGISFKDTESEDSFTATLRRLGRRAQLPASSSPQSMGGWNLLDFVVLSDGANMAMAFIGQEVGDEDDISLNVSTWHRRGAQSVDVEALVGIWRLYSVVNRDLRETEGRFADIDTPIVETLVISQEMDAQIRVDYRDASFLLDFDQDQARATLADDTVSRSGSDYHAFSIVTDGRGLSLHLVESSTAEESGVAITVGLARKLEDENLAILSGDYVVAQLMDDDLSADGFMLTNRMLLSFNGNGGGSFTTLSSSVGDATVNAPFIYTVLADGRIEMGPEGVTPHQGVVSADGKLFMLWNTGSDEVEENTFMMVGIRKSAMMSDADLAGDFRVGFVNATPGASSAWSIGQIEIMYSGTGEAQGNIVSHSRNHTDELSFLYRVAPDGAYATSLDNFGVVNSDGNYFFTVRTDVDRLPNIGLRFGIKEASGMSMASLSGKHVMMVCGQDSLGATAQTTMCYTMGFDFNGDGNGRASLLSHSQSGHQQNIGHSADITYEVADNGQVRVVLPEMAFLGQINHCGEIFYLVDTDAQDNEISFGIGIKAYFEVPEVVLPPDPPEPGDDAPEPSDYAGNWTGAIRFEGDDRSTVLTLNEELGGTMVIFGNDRIDIHESLTGLLSNGVFTFDLPVSRLDEGHEDCINWNLQCDAVLSEDATVMEMMCSGIVCGPGGGLQAELEADFGKNDPAAPGASVAGFGGVHGFAIQYDEYIRDGVALQSGLLALNVTEVDETHLLVQVITEADEHFVIPLIHSQGVAQLATFPHDVGDANLLDLVMISDGNHMAYTMVAQDHEDIEDIAFQVGNWRRGAPAAVTADDLVGTWRSASYINTNLRNTIEGFANIMETLTVTKEDDVTLRVNIRNESFLLAFDAEAGRATLMNAPVTNDDGVFHAFSLVTDGQDMSIYLVHTELEDAWDVAITVGLATKLEDENLALLSGDYIVSQLMDDDMGANGFTLTNRMLLSFDGNGEGSFTSLSSSVGDATVDAPLVYTVLADGRIQMGPEGSTPDQGVISADGKILLSWKTDPAQPDNHIFLMVGIKKSAMMDMQKLEGAYRISLIGGNSGAASAWSTSHFEVTFTGDGEATGQTLSDSMGSNGDVAFGYNIGSDGAYNDDGINAGMVHSDGHYLFAVRTEDNPLALRFGIKKSTAMSNASLIGTYTTAFIGKDHIGEDEETTFTYTVQFEFDGQGSGTVDLLSHSQEHSGQANITYTMTEDGEMTIELPDMTYHGTLNADGELFYLIDTDATDNEISFGIGVKTRPENP